MFLLFAIELQKYKIIKVHNMFTLDSFQLLINSHPQENPLRQVEVFVADATVGA